MPTPLKNWFPYFLFAGILQNIVGLFTDILEPDSALYATIAKHIAVTNDWVNLYASGHEWLDKPHLPFWLCAFSFKCFGITAFAYKLPAFLCWLLGVFYTYKLAKTIYNDNVAKLAVLVYITALHVVLSNFDTRAEPFLTTFIIAAIFHIYRAMNYKWAGHILLAALYCALAVMTKGIFVLVTIVSGFIIYWIYTKQYRELLNARWFVLIILTFLFITPELYCLYVQFDLHPEKIIFGHTNVSGIKFFFWDSQFGRFFNNGPIKGSGDIFFFIHTFLWAFIPWSLITIIGITTLFMKRDRDVNKKSLIITGGLLVTFIMFSVSKFQLPHYIIIVFPQFAIITSDYLLSLRSEKVIRILNIVQLILFLMGIAFIIFITRMSGLTNWSIPLLLIVIGTLLLILFFRQNNLTSLIGKGISISMMVYLFCLISIYPPLLQYQAGMVAAKWLNDNSKSTPVVMYRCDFETFDFYTKATVNRVSNMDSLRKISFNRPVIIFTASKEMEKLKLDGSNLKVVKEFRYFHISKLTRKFLQKETREDETEKYVLAEYSVKN